MRRLQSAALGALLLAVSGCVPYYVVPEPLERQVDRRVSFSELRRDAAPFKGASVVLGGAVLSAKFVQEGTLLEVLQLPLDEYNRPAGGYEHSEGRFLLIDPERRDPAVLQRRLITAVAEVAGMKTQKVDEVEYAFPYLSARFIHVWQGAGGYPAGTPYPYSYPYYYPTYYPYAPYYPFLYVDPFFWIAPSFYYGPSPGPPGGPAGGPGPRTFDAPPGGSWGSSPGPAGPGPGGGGGRVFR